MPKNTKVKNKKVNKKVPKNKNQKTDKFDFDEEMIIGLKKAPKQAEKLNKKKNNGKNKRIPPKVNKKVETKKTKNIKKENTNTQQKIKNKNKKKKPPSKLKQFIIKTYKYIIVTIILIGIAIFFMLSPLFNITKIEVMGNKKISAELIANMSGIVLDENIFKINKTETIKKIKEEPYMESVKVVKKLPDTILFDVVERQATYALEFVNTYVYINNQGYILEISETKAEIPTIIGYQTPTEEIVAGKRLIKEDLQKLEVVLKIMETAKSNEVVVYITKIDVTNRNNFKLILETEGKTVYLGDASNITTRIQHLKNIIGAEQGKRGEIFIDGDMNSSSATFREEV